MESSKPYHLAYAGLLLLLGITVGVSFLQIPHKELISYGFATLKALLILFVFMKFHQTNFTSKLYFVLGFVGVANLILYVMNDLLFRP